ncbi:Glu/Leu/Phe/Val dehydrogenase family protein [Neptuniibacter caesariensis]|uniref:Leucine dehydrogenase n=1 Tax=Neptuniibacter caesariensis TaxID=207954 RepID=A0A7U8GRF1_NEPCE|nr:Glu/Leu/Phe/Val dehydrogenase family protein [Neptuniibacter caesariensis]EAR61302.1 leucine dehydrogenase [Oceanospirillum sp. MED92] [Neptuniibacter caesariensis]
MNTVLFDHPEFDGHVNIFAHFDEKTGLKAMSAVHRSWNGKPAVGGCRLRNYASADEAFTDLLRLSKGMTYKSVLAGLDYGGSKSVMIANPETMDRRDTFLAMGDFVESLGGKISTGVDVGLTAADVEVMGERTSYLGGRGALAPDLVTAYGVLTSILAAVRHRKGNDDLTGMHVAVQGLGKVGYKLVELLLERGAKVVAAEVNEDSVARARDNYSIDIVDPSVIHAQDVDIYSPCALGMVINDQSINEISAGIVAGAANNQLTLPGHGVSLAKKGVLYVPDYISNCGGLLAVANDLEKSDESWVWDKVAEIAGTLDEVFTLADREGIATSDAADQIGAARIAAFDKQQG